MAEDVYDRLADALDRLPNGFPRTSSRVEIPILKRIFSPEEASLASQLSHIMEPADVIARRVGFSAEDAETRLTEMAKHGLLWSDELEDKPRFRLAPFVVGIYETQLESMNNELAHLVEEYFAEGGATGIMRPQPPLHRVIPSQAAVSPSGFSPTTTSRQFFSPTRRSLSATAYVGNSKTRSVANAASR